MASKARALVRPAIITLVASTTWDLARVNERKDTDNEKSSALDIPIPYNQSYLYCSATHCLPSDSAQPQPGVPRHAALWAIGRRSNLPTRTLRLSGETITCHMSAISLRELFTTYWLVFLQSNSLSNSNKYPRLFIRNGAFPWSCFFVFRARSAVEWLIHRPL